MARLIPALLTVLLLAQGLAGLMPASVEACEDGECSPEACSSDCGLCVCTFVRDRLVPQETVAVPHLTPLTEAPESDLFVQPLPHSRDILHVPKTVLA